MRQTRSYINLEVREHNKTAVYTFFKKASISKQFQPFFSL